MICTYDSLDKIEQTQNTKYAAGPFDLAVMDEAHRIAGRADKKWAIANDAKRIHADRRLYMTATPASSPHPNWPSPPTPPARAVGPGRAGRGRVRQLHGQRAGLRQEGLRIPTRASRGGRPRGGLPHRGPHPHRHRTAPPPQPPHTRQHHPSPR
ncbi:DEAD/DEAH box helicase family protein [Streptomyces chiangmaiensis]